MNNLDLKVPYGLPSEASYWFTRAAVNASTAKACGEAGFTDAARLYATRSVLFLADGFEALARAILIAKIKPNSALSS